MGINIYVAESYSALIKKVGILLKDSAGLDKNNIVFCEDKIALSLEREVAKSQGGGSFNTFVTSFIRFLQLKGQDVTLLKQETCSMIVKKILLDLEKELKCFSKCVRQKSLPNSLYNLITTFKNSDVSPEELNVQDRDIPFTLKNKIEDLSKIYFEYDKYLKENGLVEENTYLDLLPTEISNSDEIKNSSVYVCGFSFFTRQMLKSIRELILNAKELTFVLIGSLDRNKGFYLNETIESVINIASETGAHVNLLPCLSDGDEVKKLLRKELFSAKSIPFENRIKTNKIKVFEGETIEKEVTFVAENIKRIVMQENIPYRKIMLLLGNVEEYREVIQKVFLSYELPYYMEGNNPLFREPIVSFIFSYLNAHRRGLYYRDVLEFSKNTFFQKDKLIADLFENYILKFAVNRNSFKTPFKFLDDNLEVIERERERLILSLGTLNKKGTAEYYCDSIISLLDRVDAINTQNELIEKLNENSLIIASKVNEQVLEKLGEILKSIKKVLSSSVLDLDEFIGVLESGIENMSVSIIPPYNDAIFISDFSDGTKKDAEVLFALGLNGNVPEMKKDVELLTDSEIDALSTLPVKIEPKIERVNMRKKEKVGLSLTAFNSALYLSRSYSTLQRKQNSKSVIIPRVTSLFLNGTGEKIVPLTDSIILDVYSINEGLKKRRLSYSLSSLSPALSYFANSACDFSLGGKQDFSLSSSLYKAYELKGKKEIFDKLLSSVNAELTFRVDTKDLLLNGGMISPSSLESFYSCPFAYFISRGLKLEEREVGEISAPDLGTILHEIVEKFVDDIDSVKDESEIENKTKELLRSFDGNDKLSKMLNFSHGEKFMSRLYEEGVRVLKSIYYQIKNSRFKTNQEVGFGKSSDDILFKIKSEEKEYVLNGRIDRLDVCDDKYVRIIDYKSGEIHSLDKSLYVGEKLQLYLYMNAVLEGTKYIPAGLYYFPIHNEFSESEKGVYTLIGKTLQDEQVVRNMDTTLNEEKLVGEIVKAKLSYNEKTDAFSVNGNTALSKETLDALLKYAKIMAEKGVSLISSGYVLPTPYEGKCKYCKYSTICGYDERVDKRTRKLSGVEEVNEKNIAGIFKDNKEGEKAENE